ncbi:MAG TPA: molybdopterin-dependent oxidoreductase [Coleofasciculaceae cyanobacterium]|jgi:anaerobic selenocysteine-containing dehydrogenase
MQSNAPEPTADLTDRFERVEADSVERRQSTFDFTQQSGALQPDKIVDSACQFCNFLCGLKVHLKNDRVIDILGEPDDPVQAGELCVKAPMMTELVYNRFRLQTPMKRVKGEKGSSDSQFEPIDWDEALETIAAKFLALKDAGEARAIANKTSGRLPRGTGSLVGRYFELLGSPNNTDVGPVCNDAGGNALAKTFGLGNFTKNNYATASMNGTTLKFSYCPLESASALLKEQYAVGTVEIRIVQPR